MQNPPWLAPTANSLNASFYMHSSSKPLNLHYNTTKKLFCQYFWWNLFLPQFTGDDALHRPAMFTLPPIGGTRFLKEAWQELLICEIGIQRTRFHGSLYWCKNWFAAFHCRGLSFSAGVVGDDALHRPVFATSSQGVFSWFVAFHCRGGVTFSARAEK